MTVWSFFVLRENKPHVLDDLPSADADAKRPARENGLRQEVSNGAVEVEAEAGEKAAASEAEPETCTDQQPLETGAESPAEQTDRSNVEPQVRCFTLFIFIFFTYFFFFFLILIFLMIHQEQTLSLERGDIGFLFVLQSDVIQFLKYSQNPIKSYFYIAGGNSGYTFQPINISL